MDPMDRTDIRETAAAGEAADHEETTHATGTDRVLPFRREVAAFERAAHRALDGGGPAQPVPSCPGWSVADLVGHLGGVHRYVAHILRGALTERPDHGDLALYGLPSDPAVLAAWPNPERAPNLAPAPPQLTEWFTEGAADLAELFRATDPDLPVWTWHPDPAEHTAAFWLRMQTIEAAVHRWDAEGAIGEPAPVDPALAADAVLQTIQAMAPGRRAMQPVPPGEGERYRFRRTDGPGDWTVEFRGDEVRLAPDGQAAVELAGSASDLMLFLWHRVPAGALTVTGEERLVDRYFELVPPV
ncbi:maleylpyruvate isomerase family mycothiol-dependent enzyme [Streptomyces sp. NPDC089799]|uniref:maleylpyruvate isomerase family mycothiol-dependent enzyme n=1 Tax=Streptomyces sp. NPDC089799 TaxID=3155066 RepID=UPI00341A4E96